MGFTKIYLPDLETLKQLHEKMGTDAFLKRYLKYSAVLGPVDAVEYFNQVKTQQK